MIPSKKGTIQRLVRGNGQEVFYIRNLPIGYDSSGKEIMYKSPKFTSRELAEQKRNEVIQQRVFNAQNTQNEIQKDETYYRIANMRFIDFCREWVEKRDIRESTMFVYNKTLNVLEKYIGNMLIRDITARSISLAIEPIDVMIGHVKTILKNTLDKLYKLDMLDKSVIDKIVYPNSRFKPQKKIALTEEQVHIILKNSRYTRHELLTHLLFKTGMRVSEALALTWEDIEIKQEFILIHVTKTVSKDIYGNSINIQPPKTQSGHRDIFVFDDKLIELFNKYKSKSNGDIVFSGRCGGRTRYQTILIQFKKYGELIGIDLTPHVARHTYISIALSKGVDLYSLVEQVGHSNPDMILKVYGKRVLDKHKVFSMFSVI